MTPPRRRRRRRRPVDRHIQASEQGAFLDLNASQILGELAEVPPPLQLVADDRWRTRLCVQTMSR